MSAASEGISENFSFYLLSIANACSAVGRVVGGIVADRTGPINVMLPATLLAGIMTYIWPFATSIGGNIVVAIFYGYVSILPHSVVLAKRSCCHPPNVAVRLGCTSPFSSRPSSVWATPTTLVYELG